MTPHDDRGAVTYGSSKTSNYQSKAPSSDDIECVIANVNEIAMDLKTGLANDNFQEIPIDDDDDWSKFNQGSAVHETRL